MSLSNELASPIAFRQDCSNTSMSVPSDAVNAALPDPQDFQPYPPMHLPPLQTLSEVLPPIVNDGILDTNSEIPVPSPLPPQPPKNSTGGKPPKHKINISYIDDNRKRQVSFCKRKNGAMKKGMELNQMTGSMIGIFVFNPANGWYHEFGTHDPIEILREYAAFTGPSERRRDAKFFDDYEKRMMSRPLDPLEADNFQPPSGSDGADHDVAFGSDLAKGKDTALDSSSIPLTANLTPAFSNEANVDLSVPFQTKNTDLASPYIHPNEPGLTMEHAIPNEPGLTMEHAIPNEPGLTMEHAISNEPNIVSAHPSRSFFNEADFASTHIHPSSTDIFEPGTTSTTGAPTPFSSSDAGHAPMNPITENPRIALNSDISSAPVISNDIALSPVPIAANEDELVSVPISTSQVGLQSPMNFSAINPGASHNPVMDGGTDHSLGCIAENDGGFAPLGMNESGLESNIEKDSIQTITDVLHPIDPAYVLSCAPLSGMDSTHGPPCTSIDALLSPTPTAEISGDKTKDSKLVNLPEPKEITATGSVDPLEGDFAWSNITTCPVDNLNWDDHMTGFYTQHVNPVLDATPFPDNGHPQSGLAYSEAFENMDTYFVGIKREREDDDADEEARAKMPRIR